MSAWEMISLLAFAGGAIGCLFCIYKAIEKLSNGIFSIRTELTKMNAKLEAVEINQSDTSFVSAIRDLEKLAKPRG